MKPGTIIKSFITKKGRQAIIRVLKPTDLKQLLKFANDLVREDTFVLMNEPITIAHERKYLADAIKQVKTDKKIHLVAEIGGQIAASCDVKIGEKRKNHTGEIGISVASGYREEGIGTVCLQALISTAKNIGLKLLFLHCFENNPRAIHTYEKSGFTKAGIVPGVYSYKGEYIGEVTYYLKIT